jgi:Na+-transporting methylmalonyl-CoA/oxaloacetate decarboxylase gamma subunit
MNARTLEPAAAESHSPTNENESRILLAALSVANAIGFMPSTCMPVWVGQLAAPLGWPSWTGGALATVQLACLTLANLTGPRFIGSVRPHLLGPAAALAAAGGFLLMAIPSPAAVILGAVTSGVGCGWLLASVNSITACFRCAQRAFAMLQLVLVALGVVLFFTLPRLLVVYGVASVFVLLAICAAIGALIVRRLPREAPEEVSTTSNSRGRVVGDRGRAMAVLFGLALTIGAQTALMACIMDIGQQVGLSPSTVGTLMSAAAVCCLASPLSARLLGDRLGLRLPLVASTLALALTAALVVRAHDAVVLLGLVTALMGLPLFVLPYVLAVLAGFGGAGRWAAIGPGFMMAGAAAGPAVAGLVRTLGSLSNLGGLVALAIAAAAAVFAFSSHRLSEEL